MIRPRHRAFAAARRAFAAAVALALLGPRPLSAAGQKVLLVKSSAIPPFEQAAAEFKKCLTGRGVSAVFKEVVLPQDSPQAEKVLLLAAAAEKPSLIVTVGGMATKLAREKAPGTPSVFCMVLDPASDGLSSGGVAMDPRPEDYAKFLRDNFPQFKRIGILYNPLKAQELAGRYRGASVSPSVFVFEEARGINEINNAVDRLRTKADCLLMISDSSLYTPQTVPQILLQAIQIGLPFIALSSSFVKGGALAALYADWKDNGCQASELAAKALQGSDASSLPVLPPRRLSSALNMVVAGRLGIQVSKEAQTAALEVVR